MPLPTPPTLNEVRENLSKFAVAWKDTIGERQQAQGFWREFFACYGIGGASSVLYEHQVQKLGGAKGYIDSFIPGKLIVEAKSEGKNLVAAYSQAEEYALALREAERPRYVVVSDFKLFKITDLSKDKTVEFTLAQLPSKAELFRFLLDDSPEEILEERVADRAAAYKLSRLHKLLLDGGLKGEALDVFLTRLLFLFFADDTGLLNENGAFNRFLKKTPTSQLGGALYSLFQVLDTEVRSEATDEDLAKFPWINGSLFEKRLDMPTFSTKAAALMLECSLLDWSTISPAIFGAMFQGILEGEFKPEGDEPVTRQSSRREMGAHYTSERNILKVIRSLFLDELRADFEKGKTDAKAMEALYNKLPTLTFLDPACGCGSFLVIAYREIRKLEMDILDVTLAGKDLRAVDVSSLIRVKVNQFYGIEVSDSPAQIAKVALWVTDHQMSLESARRFGSARKSLPLKVAPTIKIGNALRVSWEEVIPASFCSYVIGNPPFVGKKARSKDQTADMALVMGTGAKATIHSGQVLDYVAAWFVKATQYIQGSIDKLTTLNLFMEDESAWGAKDENILSLDVAWKNQEPTKVGFVSTNSITQGEQTGLLFGYMFAKGIELSFAHQPFAWSNEGKGNAAVHVVIVGFQKGAPESRSIFDYPDIKGDPIERKALNINGYLEDAPSTIIVNRSKPLSKVPDLDVGNMANDGQHLLLTPIQRDELLAKEPGASEWIRDFIGATEFLNQKARYCLWLEGITPDEIAELPEVQKRVAAVEKYRVKSKRAATRKLAKTPHLFGEIRQGKGAYLVVPRHSTERFSRVPIGYLEEAVICSDACLMIPNASQFSFGILSSTMHNAWIRTVAGRIKSDIRYSGTLVYNNFPWVLDKNSEAVESAAAAVLTARQLYPTSTLAQMYSPKSVAVELQKAHVALDKTVDALYGYTDAADDLSRMRFLFPLFEQRLRDEAMHI